MSLLDPNYISLLSKSTPTPQTDQKNILIAKTILKVDKTQTAKKATILSKLIKLFTNLQDESTIQKININEWLKSEIVRDITTADTVYYLDKAISTSTPTSTPTLQLYNINKLFEETNLFTIRRILAPKSLYRSVYVMLDTNYQDPNFDSSTQFRWNLLPLLTTVEQGNAYTTTPIRNLVGMRLMPCSVQYERQYINDLEDFGNNIVGNYENTFLINTTDRLATIENYQTFNLNNHVTILIEELSNQAIISRDLRRYHFNLFPQLINFQSDSFTWPGQYLPVDEPAHYELVTTGKGDGWFWFQQPITKLDTLTLSFGDPTDVYQKTIVPRILIPIQLIFLQDEID